MNTASTLLITGGAIATALGFAFGPVFSDPLTMSPFRFTGTALLAAAGAFTFLLGVSKL